MKKEDPIDYEAVQAVTKRLLGRDVPRFAKGQRVKFHPKLIRFNKIPAGLEDVVFTIVDVRTVVHKLDYWDDFVGTEREPERSFFYNINMPNSVSRDLPEHWFIAENWEDDGDN